MPQNFFCSVACHLKEAAVQHREVCTRPLTVKVILQPSSLDSPIACIDQRAVRQSRISYNKGVPQSCQNLGELSSRSRERRDLCHAQPSVQRSRRRERQARAVQTLTLPVPVSPICEFLKSKVSLLTSSYVALTDATPHSS